MVFYFSELVLDPINGICSVRSLGPPRNADFIGKLLIKLIWSNTQLTRFVLFSGR